MSVPPFPDGYRASGVLLHVTSLPSRYGIGDVGPTAVAFPRQGQYARDAKSYRAPDLTVERIGDLVTHDLPELLSLEVPR